MEAFIRGIFMGLAITVSFGPGFVALFQTSVLKGIRAGYTLATGILLSDLLLITICYFGISQFVKQGNQLLMGTIAGAILVIFGAVSLFKSSVVSLQAENVKFEKTSIHALLLKGFLLNIANPFVTIFWLGIIGYASTTYGMKSQGFFIFFLGIIMTGFSSDLMKCYLSGVLRRILDKKVISAVNKITGAVLMIIGIVIICKVLC